MGRILAAATLAGCVPAPQDGDVASSRPDTGAVEEPTACIDVCLACSIGYCGGATGGSTSGHCYGERAACITSCAADCDAAFRCIMDYAPIESCDPAGD